MTCAHVFRAFVDAESLERVNQYKGNLAIPVNSVVPYVVFHDGVYGNEVRMTPVPVFHVVTVNGYDLAILRLARHTTFSRGYPTLQVANFSDLHEMMEVATCGFPLGDALQTQLGTVTSSFTKGMISSFIPAPGVSRENLKGFQLDLTVTNGNSGGPVFSTATGQVLGVLESVAVHPDTNHAMQGINKAGTIYPMLDNGAIDRLLRLPLIPSQT